MTDMPRAKDVAKKIEEQQRDLTETIRQLTVLRKERFSGLFLVRFRGGKVVKTGVKADDR